MQPFRQTGSEVRNALEAHFQSTMLCQASFRSKIEDVSRSLCNITHVLRQASEKHRLRKSVSNCDMLSLKSSA